MTPDSRVILGIVVFMGSIGVLTWVQSVQPVTAFVLGIAWTYLCNLIADWWRVSR